MKHSERVKVEKIDPESWVGQTMRGFPYPMIATIGCEDYVLGFSSDGTPIPSPEWKLREHDVRKLISDLEAVLNWWASK